MKRWLNILVIVCVLLTASSLKAEESDSLSKYTKDVEDIKVAGEISGKMFYEGVYEKHGEALRVWAILSTTGYENLAEEIDKNVNFYDGLNSELFYKYNKGYKFNISDSEMIKLVFINVNSLTVGYKMGMIEMLRKVFSINNDVANLYKEMAPQVYENYLEKKKQAK